MVSVGDRVRLTRFRVEAIVEAIGDNGIRVMIQNMEHALYGASIWVARSDLQMLQPSARSGTSASTSAADEDKKDAREGEVSSDEQEQQQPEEGEGEGGSLDGGSGDNGDGAASSASSSSDDGDEDEDELQENEAVVVRWKATKRSSEREYNAVVSELRPSSSAGGRPQRVKVQFDIDHQHAWVSAPSVRVMADADGPSLPAWSRPGKRVEALDPNSPDVDCWHDARIDEARRGVAEGDGDDGVRLWVRYQTSGLCQWLRAHHVKEPGAPPPPQEDGSASDAGADHRISRSRAKPPPKSRASRDQAAARASRPATAVHSEGTSEAAASDAPRLQVVRVSRRWGHPGDEVWLLLSTAASAALEMRCWFGEWAAADTRMLAPNVVVCTVPEAAAGLRVKSTSIRLLLRPRLLHVRGRGETQAHAQAAPGAAGGAGQEGGEDESHDGGDALKRWIALSTACSMDFEISPPRAGAAPQDDHGRAEAGPAPEDAPRGGGGGRGGTRGGGEERTEFESAEDHIGEEVVDDGGLDADGVAPSPSSAAGGADVKHRTVCSEDTAEDGVLGGAEGYPTELDSDSY
jgi:hypothetical protein